VLEACVSGVFRSEFFFWQSLLLLLDLDSGDAGGCRRWPWIREKKRAK
jgi:hypothetical protein